jgi:hypothetical protein
MIPPDVLARTLVPYSETTRFAILANLAHPKRSRTFCDCERCDPDSFREKLEANGHRFFGSTWI